MLTEFGKFCRKLRIDRGELLKDMAGKLNVTSAYLSAVEVGKRNIPESWMDEITSLYTLNESEKSNLMTAADQSARQVKIELDGQSPMHRQVAMVFARKLNELDEDSLRVMFKHLNKGDD